MSKRTGLFLIDLASLYFSLVITIFIRYGDDFSYQYSLHLPSFVFIFGLWVLIFYITGLYDTNLFRNNLNFYSNLLRTVVIASSLSIFFFYFVPIFSITPKTNLFIFILVFSVLSAVYRGIFNNISEKRFKKPVLIVGLSLQALELAKFIKDNPQLGYEVKNVVDIVPHKKAEFEEYFDKFGIIRGIDTIDQTIKQKKINTVVITPDTYQMPAIIDIFYKTLDSRVTFRNLSSFYEEVTSRVPLGAINQIWFLENLSEGSKNAYEELKRIFDLIFSIFLGAIILPFMPVISFLILFTSPGPVFYRQNRIGKNGKTFSIIKFRTMREDAEKETGAIWSQEDDPRITPLGRFLRKARIDELPQLWNILKGEMSFVGPRAERPEFHDKLKNKIPFYEERYIIKPGLSGWAQINYHYGSSIDDAAEKLQYDLYYIKNRSLTLDFGIILKTIDIALRQAGR